VEWLPKAEKLFSEGKSYSDISFEIMKEHGVKISEEIIRYHVYRKKNKGEKPKDGTTRTLILSDLHIPFCLEEEVINIILKHRDEIDTIVFSGDLMDNQSISSYPTIKRFPLIDEMIVTYNLLKRIDKLTPNIKKVMVVGNHEARFQSYLAKLDSQLTPLHSLDIIENVVKGFTKHDSLEKKKYIYPPLSDNFVCCGSWFYSFGDCIVAHPKNFSRIPLRTATMTLNYFFTHGHDFNVMIIGHTHHIATGFYFNKFCAEIGCLCREFEYQTSGNVNFVPQDYGYALVVQKDGITDINESKFAILPHITGSDEQWQEIEN